MARRRRRRTSEPTEATPGQPRTSIARVDYPDQDTLRLRTFWSPAPTWVYGAVPGVICALLAVVLIGGDTSVVRLLLLGGAVGYFGGGIVWAILGAMGGDVLHIEFDLKDDRARVHQSLLWVYERDWDFELDTVEALNISVRRSRPILLNFTSTFTNVLELEGGTRLKIGRFPTDREALTVAVEVSDFLGCDLDRAELDK